LRRAVAGAGGEGVGATKDAMIVTRARRLLALDGCPMSRLVSRADGLVSAQSPDLAATAIVARYHPDDGPVELPGAGHPPGLVVSPEAKRRSITAPRIPIGWPRPRPGES